MGEPLVQGWFLKLRRSHEGNSVARHLTAAWSKRYFVIVKDKVKWYKSCDPYSGEAPCGFINFQQVLRIRMLHSESRLEDQLNRDEFGTYSIEIDSRQRRLVIRTALREDAALWIKELRRRMALWTERTGIETLKEITKEMRPIDTRDHLMKRIDMALEKVMSAQKEHKEAKQAAPQRAPSTDAATAATNAALAAVEALASPTPLSGDALASARVKTTLSAAVSPTSHQPLPQVPPKPKRKTSTSGRPVPPPPAGEPEAFGADAAPARATATATATAAAGVTATVASTATATATSTATSADAQVAKKKKVVKAKASSNKQLPEDGQPAPGDAAAKPKIKRAVSSNSSSTSAVADPPAKWEGDVPAANASDSDEAESKAAADEPVRRVKKAGKKAASKKKPAPTAAAPQTIEHDEAEEEAAARTPRAAPAKALAKSSASKPSIKAAPAVKRASSGPVAQDANWLEEDWD
jgi:hypothetical protein